MEIINENRPPRRTGKAAVQANFSQHRYVYVGCVLVLTGLLWLLGNYHLVGTRFLDIFFSWPMLLIAIGGYLLTVRQYVAGGIIGSLGIIFLLIDVLNITISFNKVAMPVIVIAIGVAVLSKSHKKP